MKKVRIKSAIPIYLAALVWLLAGLIRPAALLQIGTLIVVAAASALAYFAGSKLFPGREIEVRERADSGDRDLDRQIEQARGQLDQLAKYNDALPDPAISARLDRMVRAGHAILLRAREAPGQERAGAAVFELLPSGERKADGELRLARSGAREGRKHPVDHALG